MEDMHIGGEGEHGKGRGEQAGPLLSVLSASQPSKHSACAQFGLENPLVSYHHRRQLEPVLRPPTPADAVVTASPPGPLHSVGL